MKPKFFESLIQSDGEFKGHIEAQKQKAATHPFLKRYSEVGVREGLFSDTIQALGHLHDTLVEAAYPELIGRNIIAVLPTTAPVERFPLEAKAVAYRYAEGSTTRLSGSKNDKVDITCDILAESSEEWTREFIEDASWNVMNRMIDKVGRALGEEETNRIISLYGNVADADLAGGDALDQDGAVMDWKAVNKLHDTLRSENWKPNVLVLNEKQLHQLFNDDKFIHAQYLTSAQTDLDQASILSVLGMRVQASTLVPNGTAYAIDTRVASAMLLRRDITVEDWEDTKNGKFGVRGTTRFGIGILRSNAIAKLTNISQTLTTEEENED